MMKISLIILAWNEEESISATIAGLASQSLLQRAGDGDPDLEVLVVPNGCTDGTPGVARAALDALAAGHPRVDCRLEVLEQGGKARAWNEAVHRLSAPDARYFLFMDADIRLLGAQTLENLWQALESNPRALVATDRPVKHLAQKARPGLLDRILLGAGAMTGSAPGQLTGQMYCARAETLRKIRIPAGIIVEDGFLKQMICTDGHSIPADNSRIVRADNAAHVFECYTKPRDIWHHQIRQTTGQTLHTIFKQALRRDFPQRPVYEALARRCVEDPDWFLREILDAVQRRGWWVMDTESLLMRWRRVRFGRGAARLKFAALALLAAPFDLAVFLASNARLKKGDVKGLWKDTRTTRLP